MCINDLPEDYPRKGRDELANVTNAEFYWTCVNLTDLQAKKNADYGDSFNRNVEEFGLLAALIPISNKFHRLSQLIKSQDAQIKTESIEDTLKDLACYAIMTINNLKK